MTSSPYRSVRGGELPPDQYLVHVERGPIHPSPDLLEYYLKFVSPDDFNGKRKWNKHPSRSAANDVTAEKVVMVLKRFAYSEIKFMRASWAERMIVWGLQNGLVPADEKEGYAFGISPETCDIQRYCDIYMLGSSAKKGGYCLVLSGRGTYRKLLHAYDAFECSFREDTHFLFVRNT